MTFDWNFSDLDHLFDIVDINIFATDKKEFSIELGMMNLNLLIFRNIEIVIVFFGL